MQQWKGADFHDEERQIVCNTSTTLLTMNNTLTVAFKGKVERTNTFEKAFPLS
jgi:hypothetical protein